MTQASKWLTTFLAAVGFFFVSSGAFASTDGILLVGTQTEVRDALRGTEVKLVFSENNPRALVAVAVTGTEVAVYEHDAADKIVHFIGQVVKGGICVTLEVGSVLWDLLEDTAHTVIHCGECAAKAVACILRHGAMLVVDGVTWTVKTTVECVEAAADFILHPFPCRL